MLALQRQNPAVFPTKDCTVRIIFCQDKFRWTSRESAFTGWVFLGLGGRRLVEEEAWRMGAWLRLPGLLRRCRLRSKASLASVRLRSVLRRCCRWFVWLCCIGLRRVRAGPADRK